MPRYSIHGLCIDSPTELAAVPVTDEREVDVKVLPWVVDEGRFEGLKARTKLGRALVERTFPTPDATKPLHAITVEHADAWLTLYFDRVIFRFDRGRRELERVLRRDEDTAFGDLLQAGSYWALQSTLRERVAHHASAVDLPMGGTVLIVARSGQGKSSTAAALVLAGARLRSDDVVTLTHDEHGYHCEAGSLALRMRKPIDAPLPDTLTLDARESGDGRQLYQATAEISEGSPVCVVLFPLITEAASHVRLEALDALAAFQRFAHEPRITGVQDAMYPHRRVAEITALCGRVKGYVAYLPPLSRRNLAQEGRELLAQLEGSLKGDAA